MKKSLALFAATVVAMLTPTAFAQNTDPAAAGATPLSANIDVWPEIVINDNT